MRTNTPTQFLWPIYILGAWILFDMLLGKSLLAFDEFDDIKTISRLPTSPQEVETAHTLSRADACEQIPEGEPLDIFSFTSSLTRRDALDRELRPDTPPRASSRQTVFSVGIQFEPTDKNALPALSRGTIVDYVDEHYVAIQARIRRDLLDRKLYFHHRPLALTAAYRGSRLTKNFEPLVADRISEFHGLGLFISKSEETRIRKPTQLRTMVLLFQNKLWNPNGRPSSNFEFSFIRGREASSNLRGPDDELEHHVFVTTEDRKVLHYLRDFIRPTRGSNCSILGRAVVTEFDSSGLYPQQSATRSFKLLSRQEFPWSKLDEFCDRQGLSGGFSQNVTVVLDAIIDGEL